MPHLANIAKILKTSDHRIKLALNNIIKRKGVKLIHPERGSHTLLVSNYHRLKGKVNTNYEDKIIGLNFHTKNSLDGGIELADLVSYVSCQTLRFKSRLVNEYKNIDPEVIKVLRELRRSDLHSCECGDTSYAHYKYNILKLSSIFTELLQTKRITILVAESI